MYAARTVVSLLPAVFLACVTNAECETRTEAAILVAVTDAASCQWAPDALEEPDCGRLDPEPLLDYYATWCGTAALSCIDGDTDATYICYGSP